jgi:hypothetical protein
MTFGEWFELNKSELEKLLRTDQEEMLYKAWAAGYAAGLDNMGNLFKGIAK